MGMVIQMRDLHGLNEQLRASTPDTVLFGVEY